MIVTRLLEGGSALKSGQILQGDIIYSIDDVSTSGWSMLKVWAMCKRFLEATMTLHAAGMASFLLVRALWVMTRQLA